MAELDAAPAKTKLTAVRASYRRRDNRIAIELSNGLAVSFPLSAFPGLESASPEALRRLVIEGRGYGLHVPALDVDISIPRLFEDHLGLRAMLKAQARSRASAANGRRGGRPKKPAEAA